MATGNFKAIAQAMGKRREEVKRELTEGIAECTRLVWDESRKNMQALIYANPPDTNKASHKGKGGGKVKLTEAWRARAKRGGRRGGKGFKWTQTGNLLRSEHKRTKGTEGWVENAAKAKRGGTGYAHARHNLALSGGDPLLIPPAPKKKRKSTRVAPFRALAIRDTEEARKAIMRGRLHAALVR